jgi:hypothetical protein
VLRRRWIERAAQGAVPGLVSADMDGDGALDLVVANRVSNDITVLVDQR